MTLQVQENNLTVEFSLNLTNLALGSLYAFTLTSQYSHQPLVLDAEAIFSNERYTTFSVQFPIGFGDSHYNGVYYYNIAIVGQEPMEKGLVKIITEPGGSMGAVAYESTIYTDERVSEVFYRPNY